MPGHRSSGRTLIAVAVCIPFVAFGAGCDDTAPGGGQTDAAVDAAVEAVASQALPASFKGYELYAWEESDLLWFTLITGTNRLKTLDEITAKNVDRRDDFVQINSSGWDNLQRILTLVPRGTQVILAAGFPGLPPLSEPSRARIVQMLSGL